MLNSYVVSATIFIALPNLVTPSSCQQDFQAYRSSATSSSGKLTIKSSKAKANKAKANNANLPPAPSGSSGIGGRPPEKPRGRSRCCPYDFDSTICEVVDDRVLCGFNRNIGKPHSNANEVQLGNDCRLRGGRLECGYLNGPFTNPRRPPPTYNEGADPYNDANMNFLPSNHDKDTSEELEENNKPRRLKMSASTPDPQHKSVTRCVEIRDRIVCREM